MGTRYIIITILISLFSYKLNAQLLSGKVVAVADGDTFTLLISGNIQYKIRLHGIDCPEKSQDFGRAAKEYTSNLIFGKKINVKPTDVDGYGRTIGIAYLPDGTILNELLLKNGLAWHYSRYDNNINWKRFEQQARKEKRGLWKQSNFIAPWEYRKL